VEEKGSLVSELETHIQLDDPWKRSWLRARRRRAEAARMRRRRFRVRSVKGCAAAVALVTAVVGSVAAGHSTDRSGTIDGATQSPYGYDVAAVQQALGVAADGVYGPQTRNAVIHFQRQNGLLVDGIVGPETAGALGIGGATDGSGSGAAASGSDAGNASSATLQRIAECESGGNPRAVGGGGLYRGKYQFSQEAWQAVGGTGDPAAAPEAEQDRRAAQLLRQSGTSPWPNCG
jgi:peptidoglycan hydrolase-like protein with peptidoglycan-binding domain